MNFRVCRMEYRSSDGINTIVAKIYIPQQPKGVIQIVHGMCEHIDRYEEFMRFLACSGYVVCGNNHLGHGESCASPKDFGYFGENQGYTNLIKDVRKLHLIIQKDYPDLPQYMLGHSMGSFITRVYLTKYADDLSGVILSGTGGPNPMINTAIQLSYNACRQRGGHYRPKNIHRLAFGNFNHRIRRARTERDWLTSDKEQVDKVLSDPYCMFTFTAAGFKDLFSLHYLANLPSSIESIPKDLPILLISGMMDPVGNYGRGVRKVQSMMLAAGMKHIQMQLYPHGRHEMLNEVNRSEVYEDILHWIEGEKE